MKTQSTFFLKNIISQHLSSATKAWFKYVEKIKLKKLYLIVSDKNNIQITLLTFKSFQPNKGKFIIQILFFRTFKTVIAK